jgi:EmrB/QacA subfamily drug resistance transporter
MGGIVHEGMSGSMTGTATQSRGLDRAEIMALIAMALGVFIIANDFTALSVALPQIENEFDSDVGSVQWVINAYALVFGVLIVTGGRLADIFGRRELFFIGSAVFATFSVLGGLAPNVLWLVVCRALMGIGGAMIWPAVLGMTYSILPAEKAGLAGGLILGTAGLGNAMGPLLGGFLTDSLSWRWILILNLPIAGVAAFVTWREVRVPAVHPESKTLDYRGILALSVSLVAFLLALDQVSDYGWTDPRILGLLAIAVVVMTLFVLAERAAGENALLPADVVRNPTFAAACAAVLLMSAVFFVAVVYLPQFFVKMFNDTALEAGLGLLPMMGTFAISSFVAGRLYSRLGAKTVVVAGAGCIAVGMFILSLAKPGSSYESLIAGMAILGMGVGLFYSSITTAAVTALDPSRSSLAGGVIYMFQIAGGAIGLGLTTSIFTQVSEDKLAAATAGTRLTAAQLSALDGILAGTESARQALAGFPPEVVRHLVSLTREAFIAGFEAAFKLDAFLALGGAIVALLFVGGTLHKRPS